MPVKPVIKEDPLPGNPGKVWPDKMPTRKVLKLESTTKAKYGKLNENIEEGYWEDPTGGKFKRKGAIEKSREGGPDQKTSIFTRKINVNNSNKSFSGFGIKRGPGSGEAKGLRAREEKMAKSFYAPESEWGRGGYYSKMEGTEGNVSKAIRSDIKDIRAERKEFKNQESYNRSGSKPALQGFREDIKTGRLSARYAKRGDLKSLDTDPTDPNAGGVWKAGQKSKLKIYTPDLTKWDDEGAMSGYVSSAEKNIDAARLYQENERTAKSNQMRADFNKQPSKIEGFVRSAEDNAANRNTVKAQMEKYKGWNRFVQ